MPPRGREVEKALLAWVNGFEDLPFKPRSLADFSDGAIFLKILEHLDPSCADVVLEKTSASSKWLVKKKNLEKIHKSLLRYMNNTCDFPSFALGNPVDLNAVAEHRNAEETTKFLCLFLMAAIKSPENEQYILKIQALDSSVAGKIAEIIQAMEVEAEQSPSLGADEAGSPPISSRNAGLAIEEEFAKLTKQHETLLKRHADERTNNDRLQMHNQELLDTIREKEIEIEQLAGSNNQVDADFINNLKIRIREQEDLIARQEAAVEENRVNQEKREKELHQLRPLVRKVEELQDEVKELQASNEALTKKANKVDRYEEKLKGANAIEKELARLRDYNSTLENNQSTFDRVHQENEKLQSEVQVYRKRMEAYELDHSDHRDHKNRLEHELRTREALLEELQVKKVADEEFIQQLQEQLVKTNADVLRSPDSPTPKMRSMNLEAELEQSEGHHSNSALEISRLKAEIQVLKSSVVGANSTTIRVELDEARMFIKRLESQIHELTENHAIGQEQLRALLSNQSSEKDEAISNTRKLWLDATKELSKTRSQLAEVQTKLTESDRQLVTLRADLSAMDKEELDAIEELKTANETVTASLRNELEILQGQHKALTADFEQQKNQLIEAFLSKNKAQQDLNTLKDMGHINDDVLLAKDRAEQKLKAEKERSELNEQIKNQELVIADLQQQLKESTPDAQKAKSEAVIKNLIRENALITTAWYDLTNRLQSNNVLLQRRQEAPKGWLNRQRQMVNATPRR